MTISNKTMTIAALKNQIGDLDTDTCSELKDLIDKAPESYLLDAKRISELFNIHIVSVYRWKADGLLPDCVKIKRRLYWRLSDIKDFITSQMVSNKSIQN